MTDAASNAELVRAPDALPDAAIDDVVSALMHMQEAATLQFALAIGQCGQVQRRTANRLRGRPATN